MAQISPVQCGREGYLAMINSLAEAKAAASGFGTIWRRAAEETHYQDRCDPNRNRAIRYVEHWVTE